MNDLISRSALKRDLINRGFFPVIVKCALEAAPAVDAVEVVRCWKCKHYNLQLTAIESETMCCTINAEYDPDVGVWYGLTAYPPADFYCADGERKTE